MNRGHKEIGFHRKNMKIIRRKMENMSMKFYKSEANTLLSGLVPSLIVLFGGISQVTSGSRFPKVCFMSVV